MCTSLSGISSKLRVLGAVVAIMESKVCGIRNRHVASQGLDHVLMATGRKPNTHNLGLEEVCSPDWLQSSCSSTPC